MLPPHLHERIEPGAPPPRDGAFVVYWMRIAARVDENPALDVALTAAKALKKPVFIYHALSERYRYASDRLHTFILEGARDVQRACAERGLGYAFHLERGGSGPVLRHLAKQAALVVTDFMPVQPMLRWDAELARDAPLWRVDASCVAPVWTSDVFDRAFSFREKRRVLWRERNAQPWPEVPPSGPAFLPELPFTPLDLSRESLPELVASCEVDHAVAPVHHTPGGTSAALARWRAFHDTKLVHYEFGRMDPTGEGTSRLSGYLHFGHVSPFRVAREAAKHGSKGAEKFLDELLVWRELAWNFCLHHPKHETIEALPMWARETLKAHERDGRTWLPSWEQLARAQTGDLLWDAAQRQLLTHGELHNAVRMTWGKALVRWTRNATEALSTLIDLNHRYALDGRDPASYGGIAWCLGALDRPFDEKPYFGKVRHRSTEEHGKQFKVAEYEQRVHRPARGAPLTVAVIGGGVAGLAAARTMVDAGHVVRVFERSTGPGGRMATHHDGALRFDVGVPYFTVKDERFARWARAWWQERILNRWNATIEGDAPREHASELVRLVGVPGMDSVVKRLQHELDVRFHTDVRGLTRDGSRWRLMDAHAHALGEFDAVVLATPAPIAAELVDPTSFELGSQLREVKTAPCWTVMLHFEQGTGVPFDGAYSHVGPLAWLGRNSSKPERPQVPGESWVINANAEWSRAHDEATPESVLPALLEAFFATTGMKPVTPTYAKAVLRAHALTERTLGTSHLWVEPLRLAVCGGWCLPTARRGEEVEAAFLSGTAAAARINALPPGEGEDRLPPVGHARQLDLLG